MCDIHTYMKVIANGHCDMVLPVTCHISAAVLPQRIFAWLENHLEGVWMTATVPGIPKLSIVEAGSSKIGKVCSMSTVVMKIERLAMCCPEHALQIWAQVRFQIHALWHRPLAESACTELNVTTSIDPSLRVEDFWIWEVQDVWVICNIPRWRCFSCHRTLVRKLTSDLQQLRCRQGSDNRSR